MAQYFLSSVQSNEMVGADGKYVSCSDVGFSKYDIIIAIAVFAHPALPLGHSNPSQ